MYTKTQHYQSLNAHKLINFLTFAGVFIVFFLFTTEKVLAEDFRDQQDRMRNDYYDQIDAQREMNRVRDHEELRQTQTNQAIKYREQDEQMRKSSNKIRERAHPYEPEMITHDRGTIDTNQDHQGSKIEPKSDDNSGNMPKVNVDKL